MKLIKKHTRLIQLRSSAVSLRRTVRLARKQLSCLSEIFLEIIIAPDFTPEALEILTKKKNIRLLKLGELATAAERKPEWLVTTVDGGMLVQESDVHSLTEDDMKVVTERKPTEEELKQLLFAWKVVKHVKSNAIVLVADDMTVGVGAGQMNRVGAAKLRSSKRRKSERLRTCFRCILPNGRYS